jgi:NTP pyrophosphatase (non-canonical NTP hydrolase)
MISKETVEIVKAFRDQRSWAQFHNPKDLAISLSLEASELLEIFQWSGTDLVCEGKLDKIREELADVLCYSILLADRCGLDMDEIIVEKVKRNGEKYPVEAAYGSKEKYTELKAQKEN